MEFRKVFCCAGALSIVFVLVGVAHADIVDPAWQVAVHSNAGFGVFEVSLEDGVTDPETGVWTWAATEPVAIMSEGGATLAVLNDAAVTLDPDPQIAWNFAVQAGELDAEFEIRSSLVSFATIAASVAEGRASAGFTVTDLDGDGAILQALGAPGAGAFTAAYNGWWEPGSTEFVSMINMVSASPGGTGAMSQSYPSMPPWWVAVGDDVNNMSSRVWFSLTANDSATGSNNYEMVPEPSTIGLLLLGMITVVRRRSGS